MSTAAVGLLRQIEQWSDLMHRVISDQFCQEFLGIRNRRGMMLLDAYSFRQVEDLLQEFTPAQQMAPYRILTIMVCENCRKLCEPLGYTPQEEPGQRRDLEQIWNRSRCCDAPIINTRLPWA